MEEIIKPFERSLFDDSIGGICTDMFEVSIDSLLEAGPIQDIPIVGTIVKTAKFAQNIYDRNLLKQTLVFIQQFNKEQIDFEKLKKYKESLEENPKKAEKELGRVLVILNKIIDSEKTVILVRLYIKYINKEIAWEDFCELSEINDRLFVKDIEVLFDIHTRYPQGFWVSHEGDYIYQRLISIALLTNESGATPITFEPTTHIKLTQLGHIFCRLVR